MEEMGMGGEEGGVIFFDAVNVSGVVNLREGRS